MTIALSNATFTRITFYTWANGRIDAYDDRGVSPVVRVETSKTLGAPAGTWSVGLKGYAMSGRFAGKPWADLVDAGDWVTIDFLRNGVLYGGMVGTVDAVSIVPQAGDTGAGLVDVTIAGRDLGAALADTPVYFNPYDPLRDNVAGRDMLQITDGTVGGNPGEFLVKLIRGFMGADGIFGGHLRVPADLVGPGGAAAYWADLVDLDTAVQKNLRGQVYAPQIIASADAPSVWGFVDSWRNPVLNEMFIDTSRSTETPRTAYLYLRERPFVNAADGSWSPWFSLPTHRVPRSTVRGASITRGPNRVNHLTVTGELTDMLGADAGAVARVFVDMESVAKYGLRRHEEQTRYFDEDGAAAFGTKVAEWTSLVLSWNCLNHRTWAGQLALGEMRPEIRIGQKVALTDGPLSGYPALPRDAGRVSAALAFYVEGVTHTWTSEPPTATTTLQVTRGYADDKVSADTRAAHDAFVDINSLPPSPAPAEGVLYVGPDGPAREAPGGTGGWTA